MEDQSEEATKQTPEVKQVAEPVKVEVQPIQVAFDGFEKTEIQQLSEILLTKVPYSDLKIIANPPSKLTNPKQQQNVATIVISKLGAYNPPKALENYVSVVTKQWVKDCQLKKQPVISQEKLKRYGFIFSDAKFFVYDSSHQQGGEEDPMTSSAQYKRRLSQQNGLILESIDARLTQKTANVKKGQKPAQSEEFYVIIQKPKVQLTLQGGDSMGDHFNKEIKSFIDEYKLTAEQFESLIIVSEQWTEECMKLEEAVSHDSFNVGLLFKLFTQGDRSMFHQSVKTSTGQTKSERKSGKSIPELIETFSRTAADEDLILEDCVVAIISGTNDETKSWSKLASMLGSTVTDQIMASFTTHVITQQVTPLLKQQLSMLQSRAIDAVNKQNKVLSGGNSDQGQTIVGHSHSIKIVTSEWLEACLMQKAKVPEEIYLPELAKTNKSLSTEEVNKFRRLQYNVKRGLFKNQTFAINEEAYLAPFKDGSGEEEGPIIRSFGEFDAKEEMLERMIQLIIENGGKVVDISQKSHYFITEDGTDSQIWNHLGNGDHLLDRLNRKTIHFRWILQCIQKNQMVDERDQMHLLPLPHRIPVKQFEQAIVTLTLFDPNDREVFECLVKLYGFGTTKNPSKCTHIVVHKEELLISSKTLEYLFIRRSSSSSTFPQIVNLNWLIDSMISGKLEALNDQYLVKDLAKVFK